MLDRLMGSKFLADFGIETAFIRMQPAFPGDILGNDRSDSFLIGDGGMECAHPAAPLDQGDDRALVCRPGTPAFGRLGDSSMSARLRAIHPAVVSFIGFDNSAVAAE